MTNPVTHVLSPRSRDLGGFSVRRVLPSGRQRMVGPFIFFDHMGPATFPPGEGIDVRPHPHINLATVTYLFSGSLHHRDSVGAKQNIEPGAVNWMTAGRGIVHSERSNDAFRAAQSTIHGIQSWVALPLAEEECEPRFDHFPASALPERTDDGVVIRVIAGSLFGMTSPVPFNHPIGYAACHATAASDLVVPPDYSERAVYIAEGEATIGDQTHESGAMLLLTPGVTATLTLAGGTRAMVIAGEPFAEPRHIWWNFASSRLERIEQAKRDWREHHFDAVPGEHERIPLPEES